MSRPGVTLLTGDCREVLKTLADESVQCCVTSPPYWGLRDYGTATWEGGDAECDHTISRGGSDANHIGREGERVSRWDRDACLKCGARRVDAQLGLEATPEEYVAHMVEVFREVRRVLRDDGTLWLNLGDSYASGKGTCFNPGGGENSLGQERKAAGVHPLDRGNKSTLQQSGLKPKDLVGIPWRVAFALQADGWYLRSDIIWHKTNPMPESVTDRPTKAHEYLFLLAKSANYYYDAEAVKEVSAGVTGGGWSRSYAEQQPQHGAMRLERPADTGTRNRRSVWTIATRPFSGAHFATFPPDLVRPCILAGTSERGRCPICGAPWERVTEKPKPPDEIRNRGNGSKMDFHTRQVGSGQKLQDWYNEHPATTAGWRPTCSHDAEPVPCVVLDPFGGAGTVGVVAKRLGRDAVLIDLNPVYVEELARPRIERTQPCLEGIGG